MALEVVQSEPELPGDMSLELQERLHEDPEEFCRNIVRATKRCIAERLRQSFREMDEELRHMIEQGPAVVMVGKAEFLRLMSAAGEDPRALGNPPKFGDERVVKLAQAIEHALGAGALQLGKTGNTFRNAGAAPSLVLAREVLHHMEGQKS